MTIHSNLRKLQTELPESVTLVAVSKTKPIEDLMQAYEAGQRIFGENKVQELKDKFSSLPQDIQWHMIGHLQRNKVKYIASFVALIHGVDSLRLLQEINRQGALHQRKIPCLLQVHIAQEETKFGWDISEVQNLIEKGEINKFEYVRVDGLMGMATFTDDEKQITKEFTTLKILYNQHQKTQGWKVLSMGMSNDYQLAISCGSNMVRVGSKIFGERQYAK